MATGCIHPPFPCDSLNICVVIGPFCSCPVCYVSVVVAEKQEFPIIQVCCIADGQASGGLGLGMLVIGTDLADSGNIITMCSFPFIFICGDADPVFRSK